MNPAGAATKHTRFSLSPDGRYLVYTACKKNSARGVPEWPYPEWRLLIQDLDNVKRMPLTFVTNAYYPDVPRYYLTRLGLAAREIVLHCEEVLPSSQLCYPEENRLQIKGSFDNFWVVTADITYFEDDTEDGELDLRVVYPTAIRALASYG
ncbi:hypothetical protein FA09DRAFT_360647 [Tilletiopsis washingtonensis]|uniref:Uncharacterized protein n=1 Tax=Tilletiopsis washingtonensis TaxID=58919 RepID=A0A316ZA40_9BASI|nr:hypothetical protein FA09DRAFT_360647 [Tilletiopsis washingtonensis]PWN97822.1 hypothetical protein FA09DRAFT_360647 [Tilletiopsis washingtonensis]